MNAAHKRQIFFYRQTGGDGGLLGRYSDYILHRCRIADNAVTVQIGVPACWLCQAGKHLDRGSFSCAVDTQQSEQLSLLHKQIKAVHSSQIFVFLCKLICFDGFHHIPPVWIKQSQ